MIDLQSTRTTRAALALLIAASCLVGCAPRGSYLASGSTDVSGNSVPPGTARADSLWPNETMSDPYHHLCTGACLRNF